MDTPETLDALPEGVTANVKALTGALRERLQDIGLVQGTPVTCVHRGKGIAAYRIRGAVIALRNRDAAQCALAVLVGVPPT